MRVLTYKEAKKEKGKSRPRLQKKKEAREPESVPVPELKKEVREYVLFHPENPAIGYLNMEYVSKIGNEDFTIKIVNGQVKTRNEKIKDYLLKKKYELMLTKTIQEDEHGKETIQSTR